jgi:hypothetical protein
MYKVGDKGILSYKGWIGNPIFFCEVLFVGPEYITFYWKQISGPRQAESSGEVDYPINFVEQIYSPLTKLHKALL